MQKLIANYFYSNNECVLPTLGTLSLNIIPATATFGEQQMHAPKHEIVFTETSQPSNKLVNYLASMKNITTTEATKKLDLFVSEINSLQKNEEFILPSIGKFSKDENENIFFTAVALNPNFYQSVIAERVIHPTDSHTMLVGEKQTNTTAMAEFLAVNETKVKSKWWIWALVLLLISLAIIVFNINKGITGFYGKTNNIEKSSNTKTYRIVK